MIARTNPLPEPPHPNAWHPTWTRVAELAAEREAEADVLAAADPANAPAFRGLAAQCRADRAAALANAAEGASIWPGAWFCLPGPVPIGAGWRIRRLCEVMDGRPVGTVVLPYYGAAIGLCWLASGVLLATKAPSGLPDAWTDDALLTFGWKVIEELQAEGCTTGEIVTVGRVCRAEIDARLLPVSEGAVRAKADFTGRTRAPMTASLPKLGSGTPEIPTP